MNTDTQHFNLDMVNVLMTDNNEETISHQSAFIFLNKSHLFPLPSHLQELTKIAKLIANTYYKSQNINRKTYTMYKDNNELVSFTATGRRRSSISKNSKDMIWFPLQVTKEKIIHLINPYMVPGSKQRPARMQQITIFFG